MVDITTACRTCLKNNVELIDLYEEPLKIEGSGALQLAEILIFFSIQVSQEDGLPQKICQDCTKLLQLLYEFRKQALEAEKEYKKLLENNIVREVKNELDVHIGMTFKTESDNENDSSSYFDPYEVFNNQNDDCIKHEEGDESFKCIMCGKNFSNENKLLKHMHMHEKKPPILCALCSKSFQKQSSLDKHMMKHFQNKHRCSLCLESYSTVTELQEHVKNHPVAQLSSVKTEVNDNEDKFECSECSLVFAKSRGLAMHMRKHRKKDESLLKADKQTYKCDLCSKEFTSKGLLRRHMNLHGSEQPLVCPKCPKRYSRQNQLEEHLKRHESGKANICTYCSKAFTQLCSLKDHLRTHTGETPYLCSQCGKGFNNSSNLRQHMIRHSGVKPYACTLCPKSFCTKGQMKCHMSTHTGIHPYKCDECGAAFTKPNSLKKHKMIHLGVRPFVCDTCNMRFTCKDHLKRHTRIHTGEKPYKCRYCERAFTQSNDLVKHTRQHVGQNIYQCTVCDMKFRLKSELKQHYPIHYVNGEQPPIVPVGKELAPVLMLKPHEHTKSQTLKDPGKDNIDRTITITISRNGLDKNIAGDIRINIGNSDKS